MKELDRFIRQFKLESLALAILMIVLTHKSPYPLWWLGVTFIFFDIGMIGYVFNSKLGAITYNITHNYTVPTLLIAYGVINSDAIALIGYAWVFHISVDRVLGYGLKEQTSFWHTHLGKIK